MITEALNVRNIPEWEESRWYAACESAHVDGIVFCSLRPTTGLIWKWDHATRTFVNRDWVQISMHEDLCPERDCIHSLMTTQWACHGLDENGCDIYYPFTVTMHWGLLHRHVAALRNRPDLVDQVCMLTIIVDDMGEDRQAALDDFDAQVDAIIEAGALE